MLNYFFALLKAHRKLAIAVFVVTFLLFLGVGFLSPKIYEVSTSIYVHKKIPTGSPSESDLPDYMMPNLVDHVKIIKSDIVLSFVNQQLKKAFPKEEALSNSTLEKRLHVVSAKNTKVLDIKFQGKKPDYANKVIAFTLAGYENALKKIAKETTEQSLDLLEQQRRDIQAKRAEIATEISKLQTEVGTTDVLKKNESLLAVNANFQTSLEKVNAEIAASQQEIGQIQKTLGLTSRQIKGLARIREDNHIHVLQEQLGHQKTELSSLRSKYTDKYPAIKEKERAIANTEAQIQGRLKQLVGESVKMGNDIFSDIENDLGARLLQEQARLLGLQGQQVQYRAALGQVNANFSTLADHNQKINALQFEMTQLEEKERKLNDKLQSGGIEQAILEKLGIFSVISPPSKPGLNDYVFPLHPIELIISGILGSFMLALFAVVISEYASPQILDLSTMPVMAEVKSYQKAVDVKDIQSVYKNLALHINRDKMKIISLFHLCGANGSGTGLGGEFYPYCPYSPAVFARQLGATFSERNIKTLLVDCSDIFAGDESAREVITRLGEYTMYQYSGMDDFHIISPNSMDVASFEPNILKMVPNKDDYGLIILNASLSDNDLTTNLVCETAEGTVIGISRSKTPSSLIAQLHKVVRNSNVKVLGSILFQ